MKVFQKALVLSVLSFGLSEGVFSYPSLGGEKRSESEGVCLCQREGEKRDISSLQKENDLLRQENRILQAQVFGLFQEVHQNKEQSLILRETLKRLQEAMEEMVAQQKKFHQDYLRLSLPTPEGRAEKAGKLLKESSNDLGDSPLEEKK